MKFTAQEEVGLRCLLTMAREYPPGYLNIVRIAGQESLTTAYVAKLMRVLRQAGLVRSVRGQKGGYQLARPPREIYLSEVLTVLGGRFHTIDACRNHSVRGRRGCVHLKECSIRPLWSGIDLLIRGLTTQCRLSDLVPAERAVERRLRARIQKIPQAVRTLR
jgi:Rrf2 family protein